MPAAAASRHHPSFRPAAGFMLDIAAGLAATTPAGSEPGAELLIWTEGYEVWRLVWAPGAGSSWHGHVGIHSAFAVVAGTLEERRRGHRGVRRLGPGDSAWADGARPHRLRAVGDEPVTVVHVEGPPRLGPRPAGSCTLACRPVDERLKLAE